MTNLAKVMARVLEKVREEVKAAIDNSSLFKLYM
jgi:hypothetical protein